MVGLRGVPGTSFSPQGLPSVSARTQGMGRTVRQQWYGGTEGTPWDSYQSPPGPRGWQGLWDSSGMVGLRGSLQSPGMSIVPGDLKGCPVETWEQ